MKEDINVTWFLRSVSFAGVSSWLAHGLPVSFLTLAGRLAAQNARHRMFNLQSAMYGEKRQENASRVPVTRREMHAMVARSGFHTRRDRRFHQGNCWAV
jgi:hypothetical protein